jgi:DNA (cytosine-5)-methyltransferase 1
VHPKVGLSSWQANLDIPMANRRSVEKMRSATGGNPRRRPAVPLFRGIPARPGRHPQAPDSADIPGIRKWVSERTRPTAIDLFAGAGGLSLGLHQAGFDVLVGADSNEWAMETHAANLPGLTWTGDLTDPRQFLEALEVWGIGDVDLLAGGVPCQPFSRAGRSKIADLVKQGIRGKHDERAELWESFVSIARALRPRAVVVENVPDLPRWNDGAVLIGFFESLRELGYTVEARILDGFRHGVPQHRQRLVLLGFAEGRQPVWPEPSDEFVSLDDAIGDLPIIPRAQREEELPYAPDRIRTDFQREMRAGLAGEAAEVVWDHITRDVRPDDMEAFSVLEEGQTYVDLPERLRRYRSDMFTDKYKRLVRTQLCRSITAHIAKDGYWYIHPDQHRTLSIREAARVQTFPDDFRFAGTQTHRYQQIGNAVPVRLGRAVGEAVHEALATDGGPSLEQDSFRRQLLEWHGERPVRRPWRTAGDPWRVLVGELALRRAPDDVVAAMYRRLLAVAKSPRVVARDPADVEEALREMGLKTAAKAIIEIAIAIVEDFDGKVPDESLSLRSLPRVGDYLAEAVLCFGFDRPVVLVDAVTTRICARVQGHDDDRRFQLRLDLYDLAGPAGPDAALNRALLDLGEEICRSSSRLCGSCPLVELCASAESPPEDVGELVEAVVS